MSRLSDWIRDHRGWTAAGVVVSIMAITGFIISVGFYADSWNVFVRWITRKVLVREYFPSLNPLRWTGWTYFFVAIALGILVAISYIKTRSNVKSRRVYSGASIVLALASATSLVYAITGWVNNDKDGARSYASSVTYYVDNPQHLPNALKPLLAKGGSLKENPAPGACLNVTKHDVPSCIKQGTYDFTWEPRSASLTGAQAVIDRTSTDIPRVDLMKETLAYAHDEKAWTGLLNGSKRQPIYGVAQWNGSSERAESCKFTGRNKINYSFGGNWSRNLDDTLAEDYPGLLYSYEDMSGFCKGAGKASKRTPVIIIPVTEEHSYGRRTTRRPAGVLEITGTPSGEPKISHRSSVRAGDYPVPVYPLSIVAKQQDASRWSAGRKYQDSAGFGYKPSDVATQAGNIEMYLRRDAKTGRDYWLTPLTPNRSNSQLLTAYAVIAADEVRTGVLNPLGIYATQDGSRRVNITDMETRVSSKIRDQKPGFFTTDAKSGTSGTLTEFFPIDTTHWVVFLELNGRVMGQAVYSTDPSVEPVVTWYNDQSSGGTQPSSDCIAAITKLGKNGTPDSLSKEQLVDCIKQFADTLAAK